jgi:hypothetical protein
MTVSLEKSVEPHFVSPDMVGAVKKLRLVATGEPVAGQRVVDCHRQGYVYKNKFHKLQRHVGRISTPANGKSDGTQRL